MENIILLDHGAACFCRNGFLRFANIHRECRKSVDEYAVKTPTPETPARNLSGGNIEFLTMTTVLRYYAAAGIFDNL